MQKYKILSAILVVIAMAFSLGAALAQNRSFPLADIDCNSPWGGTAHVEDLGNIADPSFITIPIQDVPINFSCGSRQFYPVTGSAGQEWHAHGAACLIITNGSSAAAQRELSLQGNPTAPKLRFNFTYQANTAANFAVGDGQGNGVGIPYYGFSPGANNVPNGPTLPIGGSTNELGIYIHDASLQPSGLLSGVYEATFPWELWAGTTSQSPVTSPGNAPPLPADCVTNLSKRAQMGTITVRIEIKTSCTLELPATGKDIDFGSVTLQEIAAGVGPIIHDLEVKCNNDKDMFITIGAGLHSGGDINNRHMQLVGGSALLKYSLKKPGGGEWGDAPTLGSGHLVPGNFANTTIVPIEATIPAQNGTFPLGDYKDTVQIQLWN